MQQQRNFLFFFVLVGLFLIVYIPLRQKLLPPAPAPQADGKKAEEKKPDEKKPDASNVELPPLPKVSADDNLLTLGSEDSSSKFDLRVILDPLGGGVRSVKLNKFRPSDEDGRVAPGQGLELVPGSANEHIPSHLLYHFSPSDTALDARPLDTLGRRRWLVVETDGRKIATETTDDGKVRHKVSFCTEIDGVTITKTYSLTEGEYHIGLQVDMKRAEAAANAKPSEKEPIKFRYQLTGAKGLPIEGKWYTGTFRNAMIALEDPNGAIDRRFQELRQIDIWGGGNAIDREEGKIIRYAAVAVQYFASVIVVDERQDNQKFLRRAIPSLETAVARGKLKDKVMGRTEYLVMQSDDGKSTTTIYLPPHLQGTLSEAKEGQQVAVIYESLSYEETLKECPKIAISVRTGLDAQATHSMWEDDITVRVATEPVSLAPGATVTHRYLLYNGPVKPSLLRQLRGERAVDNALVERYAYTLGLNTMTDYQSPGGMGWFSSRIGWTWVLIKCTNLMHWVFGWLSYIVPSYGLSIILLTLMVRFCMYPVSRKQAAMSIKMQALQPELKKLKEKHKSDQAAFAQAQMALWREHGVNPVGSCWIVFLQMPIFMGLYFALQESIQFRLANFWPTWIVNLAAPDMLFEWGRSIPWLSRDADFGGFLYLGPYFNLLPLFAVALMVVQQKMLMPPPADKEQEMQQKTMRWMMIIMGIFFYKIAAGLSLYIITSTLWGFLERKMMPKAKPVGIDTNLDKRIAELTTKPEEAPSTNGASKDITQSRKPGKNKRKERGKKEEEPKSGFGKMRQRLSDWWADVLEQAKKKQ